MNDRTSSRRSLELPPALQSHGHDGMNEPVGLGAGHNSRQDDLGVETSVGMELKRRKRSCVRVLIADDHPIFRDGLRKLIESQPGMLVSGESSVGTDVVRLARELKPDIVLIDLALPGRSGLQVLNDLAGLPSPVRTLVLAAAVEESTIL
jgi:CheY-like chemotaxis protein